jgi:hypothetical protein
MALIGISGKIGSGKDQLATYMKAIIDKDTDSEDVPVRIVKFADKLKEFVCLLTGCTRRELEDQNFKNLAVPGVWMRWVVRRVDRLFAGTLVSLYYTTQDEAEACRMDLIRLNKGEDVYKVYGELPTYRTMLQELGTDVMRKRFHDNTWINATFADWHHISGNRHWAGNAITIAAAMKEPKWIITDVRFPNEVRAIKERNGIVLRMQRDGAPASDHISETALDDYKNFDAIIDNNGTLEQLQKKAIDIVNQFNLK